jgi:hypothetical protein
LTGSTGFGALFFLSGLGFFSFTSLGYLGSLVFLLVFFSSGFLGSLAGFLSLTDFSGFGFFSFPSFLCFY